MSQVLTPDVQSRLTAAVADHAGSVRGNPGESLELEARVRVDPSDAALFDRVRSVFAAHTRAHEVTIVDTIRSDTTGGKWRRAVETRAGEEDVVRYTRKRTVWQHDDHEFAVRLALALEKDFGDTPPPEVKAMFRELEGDDFLSASARPPDEVVRTKYRSSFFILNSAIRVDMTRVRTHRAGEDVRTTHEIEIEVVDGKNVLGALNQFRTALGYMLTLVQDSDIPISRSERAAVVAYISALISDQTPPPQHELQFSSLVQARDLTIRDLEYGGLVGNPDTAYTATIKADGERRLLVFTRWGVYFALPKTRLNKISRSAIPELEGTVLDGEYLPASARLANTAEMSVKHVWYAFDCLSDRKDGSVRERTHLERLEVCRRVTQTLMAATGDGGAPLIPNLTARTKDFYVIDTPQRLYFVMARLALEMRRVPYAEDGVMFTPINAPYIPRRAWRGGGRGASTLVERPEVCKWKPAEKHSIDLAVIILPMSAREAGALPFDLAVNGPGRGGALSAKDRVNLVPWRGTSRHPFTATLETVDLSTPLLSQTRPPAHGTILEFRWDAERGVLVPMRTRPDKIAPNYIDVAREVWNNIQNPLEWTTLIGRDFRLLRAHHNNIKRDLLGSLGRLSLVVDVGSGNGGDISKWGAFGRVVGVEPDAEHRAEMERRLRSAAPDVARRIEVRAGSGTALEEAVPARYHGQADAVLFMLSLSFFFARDPDTGEYTDLDALARGVARMLRHGTGVIAFLTVNGEAVLRVLRPDLASPATPARLATDLGRDGASAAVRTPPSKGVNWNDVPGTVVRLEDADGGPPRPGGQHRLFIHIPNSIVENQTEFLVDIGAFVRALERVAPGRGWHVAWHERTSSDPRSLILPEVSDALNRMYSYGVIAQGGHPPSHLLGETATPPELPPGALVTHYDYESPSLSPPRGLSPAAEIRGVPTPGASPAPQQGAPAFGEPAAPGAVRLTYQFDETAPGQWAMRVDLVDPGVWERVRQAVSDAGCSVSDEDELRRAVLAFVAATNGRLGTTEELALYAAELLCIGPLAQRAGAKLTAAEIRRVSGWDKARGFAVYGQASTRTKRSATDEAYDRGEAAGIRVLKFVDTGDGPALALFVEPDDAGVERVHAFPPRGYVNE